ncbi:MAG: gluconate 2-dehydrogenase subunit 3 family protein [Terriglobia bacterium]
MKKEEKNGSADPGEHSQAEKTDAMTRREWLQGVGGAALVAGWPASPDGVGAATSTVQGVILPSGLYTPSPEHLGHALASDSRFHTIPPGSETDYARPLTGAFKPAFFSENEFPVVRRMVEIILGLPPDTEDQPAGSGREDVAEDVARWVDLRAASAVRVRAAARALSPEHRALAIHYYGPEAVRRVETEAPEGTCREGLAWVEQVSQQKYGAGLLKLNELQQVEIIESVSDDRPDPALENAGTRFFMFLKAEATRAYYTSRHGLRELNYKGNSFHAASPGCPKSGKP